MMPSKSQIVFSVIFKTDINSATQNSGAIIGQNFTNPNRRLVEKTCISDNPCLYAGEMIVRNYSLGTFPTNATFIDKVILAEGSYRFVLMDSAGDGLIAPAICFVELIGSASFFNDTIGGVFNVTSTEVFEAIKPTEMPSSKPSSRPVTSKPVTSQPVT